MADYCQEAGLLAQQIYKYSSRAYLHVQQQHLPAAVGQKIPLEILPLGDFEPIYGSPLNVQAGELPVLPMSIYGAVAMAHAPDADEGFAAADEFFIYKYDRAASGLAGLSFDEGTFGVFGYIAKV